MEGRRKEGDLGRREEEGEAEERVTSLGEEWRKRSEHRRSSKQGLRKRKVRRRQQGEWETKGEGKIGIKWTQGEREERKKENK